MWVPLTTTDGFEVSSLGGGLTVGPRTGARASWKRASAQTRRSWRPAGDGIATMRCHGSLSRQQRAVLHWIAEGCPDGVMTGSTYKTTSYSMRDRGLATVRLTTSSSSCMSRPECPGGSGPSIVNASLG